MTVENHTNKSGENMINRENSKYSFYVIMYNKLRKLKKSKKEDIASRLGRMKLPHKHLKGASKRCPRKLYS